MLELVTGLVLVLFHFAHGSIHQHFETLLTTPFSYFHAGESRFWLSLFVLFFPGCFLTGLGATRLLKKHFPNTMFRNDELFTKPLFLVFLFLGCVFCYDLLNNYFLLNLPITDDEWGARFGGQVWASGSLTTALPVEHDALVYRFMYRAGEHVTSFDWPGVICVWFLGYASNLQGLLFHLIAALSIAAIYFYCTLYVTQQKALVYTLVYFLLPYSLVLGTTEHAHVVSRSMTAMGVVAFAFAMRRPHLSYYLFAGSAFSCAWLTRPPETTFILLPFGIFLLFQAFKRRTLSRLLAFVGPLMLALALFVLYNYLVTGDPLTIPRMHTPDTLKYSDQVFNLGKLAERFSTNLAYNGYAMLIWLLGPIGLTLLVLGIPNNTMTNLCTASIAAVLAVAMLHHDGGIHTVGPIHYSECLPLLFIVMFHGWHTLTNQFTPRQRQHIIPAFVCATLLTSALASRHYLQQIRQANQELQSLYRPFETVLEQAGDHAKIIFLAPPLVALREALGALQHGGFVIDWRYYDPRFQGRYQVLVYDAQLPELLHEAFPEHKIIRVLLTHDRKFQFSEIR